VLLSGLAIQGLAGEVEQRHVALSGASLHRAEDQAALDALELLADLDRSYLKVDVGPTQAEGLAAAQA
jgi:hypothetical protein